MKKGAERVLGAVVVLAVIGVGGVVAYQFKLLDKVTPNSPPDKSADSNVGQLYTCPMHPEVVQEEPGSCPICKMDLVPLRRDRQGTMKSQMDKNETHEQMNGFESMPKVGTKTWCPVMQNAFVVDENTVSAEYNGKTYVLCCPMCKPTFEKNPLHYTVVLEKHSAENTQIQKKATAGKTGKRKIKHWVAPMDPTYISDKPGKSPMGMDLVPVYEKGEYSSAGEGGRAVFIDPVVVQNMGVRVADVEHGPIFRHVRTIGEVEVAENEVSVVNLRFNGWIERIFVDETGQKVKRGQSLFNVYSPELMAAQEEYLLAVRADGPGSRFARSAARRLDLWGIGKSYLKKISLNDKPSKTITIKAPRAGYVLHKNVVLGAHVNSGDDLYRIGDLDRIWVNVEIYEHHAAWVAVGQKADVSFTFLKGKTWEGTVSYIYPTLSKKSRTLSVRIELENPGLNLKPGMLAIVQIQTRHKDHVTTVPSEAVIHSGEHQLVFVVRGYGEYEPREIVTGLVADNNRTEVLEGLTKGEQVVVSGHFLLDSESQLQEAVQKLMGSRLQAKIEHRYVEVSHD
jgi:Cu(I)/Ag(I) efflux system membrane fusion protein/cobalt-zinc-cadmium efflux system membrane fusion protein